MAAAALHVEVQGPEGARGLVLAHGFGGSARTWRPQLRVLRESHRSVVYDARGHARSAAPEGAGEYGIEVLASDLEDVAARSGDPRPVLGGLSMGAAVALRAALAAPGRVRALVLASYPAGPASGRGIAAQALAFAEAIDRDGLEAAGARFVWGEHAGLDAAGARLVRQGFLEHAPEALAHTLRETLAHLEPVETLAPRLASLPLPVLVIAGEGDAASLPTSRALAAALPEAQLVVIPEAGHVVNLAAPAAFNSALLRFLDALP
jgi:pimeloyl-ACP methyl ester carboxylesterase